MLIPFQGAFAVDFMWKIELFFVRMENLSLPYKQGKAMMMRRSEMESNGME